MHSILSFPELMFIFPVEVSRLNRQHNPFPLQTNVFQTYLTRRTDTLNKSVDDLMTVAFPSMGLNDLELFTESLRY